jgi:hypothetical protein
MFSTSDDEKDATPTLDASGVSTSKQRWRKSILAARISAATIHHDETTDATSGT